MCLRGCEMTKEEAIQVLSMVEAHGTLVIQAKEMAIKTLKQEPCEDAISRQAVIDITWEEPSYTDAMNVLTEVRDKVKELPPVNQFKPICCPSMGIDCENCPAYEPKTGHWIDDGQYAEGHSEHACRCSKCGYTYIGYTDKYKDCPNCGAKMAEGSEE